MFTIKLKNVELNILIGIYPHEKLAPQRIVVNVCLKKEYENILDDDINNTVSYEEVNNTLLDLAAANKYELLETFVYQAAHHLSNKYQLNHVFIEAEKPKIFENVSGCSVSYEINP